MHHIVSFLIFIFILIGSVSALAQESCNDTLTVPCLNDALIEHADSLELSADRIKLFEVIVSHNFRLGNVEIASQYFDRYGEDFSRFTIGRVATNFHELGDEAKVKLAFDFLLAQQSEKSRPSDLFSIARDQLEFGLNDDARSTLQRAAIQVQEQIKNGGDELRTLTSVAILQRLYGWPEDVEQTLIGADVDAKKIEKPMVRAFVLTDIAEQYILSGFSDLGEQILLDLIEEASSNEQAFEADHIQSAIVGTYVQLNRFAEAEALNIKFARNVDQYQTSVLSGVNILLTSENQYLLKLPSSTKIRSLKIIDKITELDKADFWYGQLIFRLAGLRQYGEALEIAELINDDDSKIEEQILIAGFMAREEEDSTEPHKLIQQYAIELDNLSDDVLKSVEYPLSLIGGAFVDEGNFEEAMPYLNAALRAKNLLQIDALNTNGRPERFWGLYHDFAVMGEYDLLNGIYKNLTNNEQKIELLGAMVDGLIKGNHLEYAVIAHDDFGRLLPHLSDEAEELDEKMKSSYPADYVAPTERSRAKSTFLDQNATISSAFAKNGNLIEARKYLELAKDSNRVIYAKSAIVKAQKSSGQTVEAEDMMKAMLVNAQSVQEVNELVPLFKSLYYLFDN